MRFADLNAADQQLLRTDLGEVEKVAAENLALADEMYAHGFNKLAEEAADSLEAAAAAASEKVASEGYLDEESEKVAADLSAFIERGFFDGLRKLGSERYGDENAYIIPFLEEKVAAIGAEKYAAEFTKRIGEAAAKGWKATKGKSKDLAEGVKRYHSNAANQVRGGADAISWGRKRLKDVRPSEYMADMHSGVAKGMIRGGAKDVAKGTGKLVAPYAAGATVLGGGAYAANKLKNRKKED